MVRKRNQVAEVNWLEYFKGIQAVCPWSLPAYRRGLIEIVHWRGIRLSLEEPLLARVYICDLNSRRLKKLAQEFENIDQNNEWLWSHPRYNNHSAPLPCLIQQNRQYLENIRLKMAKKAQANK